MNPVLSDLAAQVEQTLGVEQSAIVFIMGVANRIEAAVQEALRNGATESELAPIRDQVDAMRESAQALADAIAANPG